MILVKKRTTLHPTPSNAFKFGTDVPLLVISQCVNFLYPIFVCSEVMGIRVCPILLQNKVHGKANKISCFEFKVITP